MKVDDDALLLVLAGATGAAEDAEEDATEAREDVERLRRAMDIALSRILYSGISCLQAAFRLGKTEDDNNTFLYPPLSY